MDQSQSRNVICMQIIWFEMTCGQFIAKHSKLPHGVRYVIDYGSHVHKHRIQNFYFYDNLEMACEVLKEKNLGSVYIRFIYTQKCTFLTIFKVSIFLIYRDKNWKIWKVWVKWFAAYETTFNLLQNAILSNSTSCRDHS